MSLTLAQRRKTVLTTWALLSPSPLPISRISVINNTLQSHIVDIKTLCTYSLSFSLSLSLTKSSIEERDPIGRIGYLSGSPISFAIIVVRWQVLPRATDNISSSSPKIEEKSSIMLDLVYIKSVREIF